MFSAGYKCKRDVFSYRKLDNMDLNRRNVKFPLSTYNLIKVELSQILLVAAMVLAVVGVLVQRRNTYTRMY